MVLSDETVRWENGPAVRYRDTRLLNPDSSIFALGDVFNDMVGIFEVIGYPYINSNDAIRVERRRSFDVPYFLRRRPTMRGRQFAKC